MPKRSLYKYFSMQEYADKFIDGELYFQTLSHFKSIEDNGVRGDHLEGVSVFEPATGLAVSNLTTGQSFVLEGYRFESAAQADHIYVFCMASTFSDRIAEQFGAVACVEVIDTPKLCSLATNSLPPGFIVPPVNNKRHLGHKVRYYDPAEPPETRWALPELVAISKRLDFSWQNEFRLVFGRPSTFDFENTKLAFTTGENKESKLSSASQPVSVRIGNISTICKLHRF